MAAALPPGELLPFSLGAGKIEVREKNGISEGTESMAGWKRSFYREMIKYIQISILAVLMALLVGGALWAAEGFSAPGKSAEALADAGMDSL